MFSRLVSFQYVACGLSIDADSILTYRSSASKSQRPSAYQTWLRTMSTTFKEHACEDTLGITVPHPSSTLISEVSAGAADLAALWHSIHIKSRSPSNISTIYIKHSTGYRSQQRHYPILSSAVSYVPTKASDWLEHSPELPLCRLLWLTLLVCTRVETSCYLCRRELHLQC